MAAMFPPRMAAMFSRTARGTGSWYRRGQSLRFALTRDRGAIAGFLVRARSAADLRRRVGLLASFERITNAVRGYHTLAEMLAVAEAILDRPGAVVVEAGAGKGSSTAKLSLAVRAVGGRLEVFDSFRGLPDNDEVHRNSDGRVVRFRRGAFTGRLRAVERVVAEYGAIEVCSFHKGWFADTLPGFAATIDVALFDVDLLESTRLCLRHFVPRLAQSGVAFSQDGHLEAIAALVVDPGFWRDEVGIDPPQVTGAGERKLLEIRGSLSGVTTRRVHSASQRKRPRRGNRA